MTKLELMQKIYELSGVEPDWWSDVDSEDLCHSRQGDGKNIYLPCLPYYSLEQVLRELPHNINGFNFVVSKWAPEDFAVNYFQPAGSYLSDTSLYYDEFLVGGEDVHLTALPIVTGKQRN